MKQFYHFFIICCFLFYLDRHGKRELTEDINNEQEAEEKLKAILSKEDDEEDDEDDEDEIDVPEGKFISFCINIVNNFTAGTPVLIVVFSD